MGMVKKIRRQDSGWKQTAGCSGETSINLSNEIFDYLSYGMVDSGEECGITFRIYKKDYVDALSFIESQLPLYRSTSRESIKIEVGNPIFEKLLSTIDNFFGKNDFKEYTVGRIYLKNLKQKGFTIRDFLVEFSSALDFEMGDDCFELRLIPFYI